MNSVVHLFRQRFSMPPTWHQDMSRLGESFSGHVPPWITCQGMAQMLTHCGLMVRTSSATKVPLTVFCLQRCTKRGIEIGMNISTNEYSHCS
eukprot:2754385-Amphidinium_carterae.1